MGVYAFYLPKAYTCKVEVESDTYFLLSFYDLQGNWKFTLTQELVYDAPHFNDNENQQYEIIYVQGNQAFLLRDTSQPLLYNLIWRDSCYQYSLYGTFSSVEILKKLQRALFSNDKYGGRRHPPACFFSRMYRMQSFQLLHRYRSQKL